MNVIRKMNFWVWAGLFTAVFVATPTTAAAQTCASPPYCNTYPLGVPITTPVIELGGNSSQDVVVAYVPATSLTMDGRVSYTLQDGNIRDAIIEVTGTSTIIPVSTGYIMNGGLTELSCPGAPGNVFPAYNGTSAVCLTEGNFGPFHFSANLAPGGMALDPPRFADVQVPNAACGISNLCLTGAVVRCLNPERLGAAGNVLHCTTQNTWQVIQSSGVLLTGQVSNSLLAGQTIDGRTAADITYPNPPSTPAPPMGFDKLVTVLKITGGLFMNQFPMVKDTLGGNPSNTDRVIALDLALDTHSGTPMTNSILSGLPDWSFGFQEAARPGFLDTTGGGGFLLCNGSITGSVTDYFFPLLGVPGAEISIPGQTNIVPGSNGSFVSATNMCPGSYNVTVLPPAGYTVNGGVAVQTVTVNSGAVTTGVNFSLIKSPVNTSTFTTFSQAAWGTKPKGDNAGTLIATYFNFLYPTGELVIGTQGTVGRYSIIETGADAIKDFLPQEGRALPLTADYVDPPSLLKKQYKFRYAHHRRLGSLAGEMLALELNVRSSALYLTKPGLGSLHLATGKLATMSVDQVLAMGNSVLGGAPLPAILAPTPGCNIFNFVIQTLKGYDTLEDAIEAINKNYQAGTTDRHFLIP